MTKIARSLRFRRHGGGLVVALVTLLVVTSLMGSVVRSLLIELRQRRHEAANLQAQWLAEAAIERATARLRSSADYSGETWNVDLPPSVSSSSSRSGVVEIRVESGNGNDPSSVTIETRYPDDPRHFSHIQRTWTIPAQNKKPAAS